MRGSLLLFVCQLASAGGFPVDTSVEQYGTGSGRSNELASLATLLLASNTAAAFNPGNAGGRVPMSPTVAASGSPVMSTATEVSDQELRESLAARIKDLTLQHPETLENQYNLACALKDTGDLQAAEELLRENIEIIKSSQGFDAPDLLKAKDALAEVLRGKGDEAGADELVQEVTGLRTRRVKDGRRGAQYWSKIVRYNKQIAEIRRHLQDTYILVAMDLEGLNCKEQQELRQGVPEETWHKMVKNTIMKLAVSPNPAFSNLGDLATGHRLWLYCTEDSFKPTLEAIKRWQDEFKKQESHPILGGVMDGAAFDADGVTKVSKLPSRQDLMQQVAVGIKAIPTKVGRGLKMVPTKIGRAINLAAPADKIAVGLKLAAEKGEEKGAATMGDI